MSDGRSKSVARWASGLASGVCAIGFLLWARDQRLPHLPSTPGALAALALSVVAYTVVTLWLCERWTRLLWREDGGFSRGEGYRSAVLGQLGNVLLPMRAGDAIRVGLVSTASREITVRGGVGILVAERVLDGACHSTLLVLVVLGFFGPSIGALGRVPAALAGLGLLAGAAAMALYLGGLALSNHRPRGRAAAFLVPVFGPLSKLRHGSGTVVLLSVGMWLGEVVAWWAAAWAMGLELGIAEAAYVLAIAVVVLIAPFGFGAIGTLDAAVLFGLGTIGVATAGMLGFVLLLRLLFVLPSLLIGAGLWLAPRIRDYGYGPSRNGWHERWRRYLRGPPGPARLPRDDRADRP